jgi:branched-subunit amino acid transport protein
MVSAFFTRTTLALLTVIIVYFLSYLPYVVLTSLETEMLFWQKTLAVSLVMGKYGVAL